MQRIPLTQGQFAIVDDDDFERVSAFKWHTHSDGRNKSYYAVRWERTPEGKRKLIFLEKFIMSAKDGETCDHINHNTLDDRKDNLRICSFAENARNRRTNKNNRLGVKNIRIFGMRFQVRVRVSGKTVFAKLFETLGEAIEARDREINKHHGKFASKE